VKEGIEKPGERKEKEGEKQHRGIDARGNECRKLRRGRARQSRTSASPIPPAHHKGADWSVQRLGGG
jgi:hypothetical protein